MHCKQWCIGFTIYILITCIKWNKSVVLSLPFYSELLDGQKKYVRRLEKIFGTAPLDPTVARQGTRPTSSVNKSRPSSRTSNKSRPVSRTSNRSRPPSR
jgi:hypothetical protein